MYVMSLLAIHSVS